METKRFADTSDRSQYQKKVFVTENTQESQQISHRKWIKLQNFPRQLVTHLFQTQKNDFQEPCKCIPRAFQKNDLKSFVFLISLSLWILLFSEVSGGTWQKESPESFRGTKDEWEVYTSQALWSTAYVGNCKFSLFMIWPEEGIGNLPFIIICFAHATGLCKLWEESGCVSTRGLNLFIIYKDQSYGGVASFYHKRLPCYHI